MRHRCITGTPCDSGSGGDSAKCRTPSCLHGFFIKALRTMHHRCITQLGGESKRLGTLRPLSPGSGVLCARDQRRRSCPGSPGGARRRALARDRPRLRPADGARAAPVPDRAAAGRAGRARRAGSGRPSTTRRCSSTSAATPTPTSRRSGSATTSR